VSNRIVVNLASPQAVAWVEAMIHLSCDRSDGITPSHAYQEHDSNTWISGTPDGLVINRTFHRSICCQMVVRF